MQTVRPTYVRARGIRESCAGLLSVHQIAMRGGGGEQERRRGRRGGGSLVVGEGEECGTEERQL